MKTPTQTIAAFVEEEYKTNWVPDITWCEGKMHHHKAGADVTAALHRAIKLGLELAVSVGPEKLNETTGVLGPNASFNRALSAKNSAIKDLIALSERV